MMMMMTREMHQGRLWRGGASRAHPRASAVLRAWLVCAAAVLIYLPRSAAAPAREPPSPEAAMAPRGAGIAQNVQGGAGNAGERDEKVVLPRKPNALHRIMEATEDADVSAPKKHEEDRMQATDGGSSSNDQLKGDKESKPHSPAAATYAANTHRGNAMDATSVAHNNTHPATPTAQMKHSNATTPSEFECHRPPRQFISANVRTQLPHRKPPLLLTFPGSGNTWFRMLLEMGTGFHTGSVYTDLKLRELMPGEARCDNTTLVIKSHLHLQSVDPEHHRKLFEYPPEHFVGKYPCRELRPFDTVIGVIRDPFHAALAETTRQLTGGHAGGIGHERFRKMSESEYVPKLIRQAELWTSYIEEYEQLLKHGWEVGKDLMLIRFEDMTSPYLKHDTLGRLLRFVLGADVSSPHGKLTKEALDCIFTLADDKRVHRNHDDNKHVSAREILQPRVVCMMWEKVKHVADAFDYAPPFHIPCDAEVDS